MIDAPERTVQRAMEHVSNAERELATVLVFRVGPHRCALLLALVREVQRAVALLDVPCAPPSLEGAACVRGVLVPVIDVRRYLGVPPRPLSVRDYLVLASHRARGFALRVDSVEGIADLTAGAGGEGDGGEDAVPGALDFAEGARVLADGLVLIERPGVLLREIAA